MTHSARVLVGGAALVIAGCAATTKSPPRLLDGSSAASPPAALARLRGPLALGRMRAVAASAADSPRLHSCLRRFGLDGLPRQAVVIERLGVAGASITFRDPGANVLNGCDAVAPGGRFCGGAVGLLRHGRLLDPRLDLTCRIGFAWIEPLRGARWVAVEQRTYTELYLVAAGAPVRATTDDVKDATAIFRVRQYAADGRELTRAKLEARVAG
jgi:hypothetical protein